MATTKIGITSTFITRFNYAMDTASVEAVATLKDVDLNSIAHAKSWVSGNTYLRIDPTLTLQYNKGYNVTIGAGCTTALGKPLQTAQVFSFFTEDYPTIITSFTPANNSSDISISGTFVINFAYAMNTGSVSSSFSFVNKLGANVGHGKSWNGGRTQLTVTPSSNLNYIEPYYLTFGTGSYADNLYYIPTATQYSIVTADQIAIISSTTPEDGGYNHNVTGSAFIYFNFGMNTSLFTATFLDGNGGSQGYTLTWSVGNTVLEINPTGNLSYSTPYVITVTTGSYTAAGLQLSPAYTFSFYTEIDDIISGSFSE